MSEPMDKREEIELNLKHLEYGAVNGLASGASVVLALINEHKAALLANREKDAEIARLREHNEALSGEKFSDRNHAALKSRAETAEAELTSLRASGSPLDSCDV